MISIVWWNLRPVILGVDESDFASLCSAGIQGRSGGPQRGSAAVCDPNPPHPFAQYRLDM